MGLYEDFMNMSGQNTQRDQRHKIAQLPQHRRQNYSISASPVEQKSLIANAIQGMSSNNDGGLLGNREAEVNKQIAELNKQEGLGDANSIVGITNQQGIADINNTNNALASVMNTVNSGSNSSDATSSMDGYNKKMYQIESRGNPTAVNPKTGAFGLNQILPRYEKYYADKSGQSVAELRTVPGQLKVSKTIYDDTTKYLDKKGYAKTDKNRYIVHQQGRQGFSDLMNGKINHEALAGNIPTKFLMSAPDDEPLDKTYHRYWDSKFASF